MVTDREPCCCSESSLVSTPEVGLATWDSNTSGIGPTLPSIFLSPPVLQAEDSFSSGREEVVKFFIIDPKPDFMITWAREGRGPGEIA